MKEFVGTARNLYIAQREDETPSVRAEFVVVTSEPTWILGIDGLIRERATESFRFTLNRGGVKLLMKSLADIDRDLEDMEKRFPFEPQQTLKEGK